MPISQREQLARTLCDLYLPGLKVLYNPRPAWLMQLELDLTFPEIGAAIEIQGEQHGRPLRHFHRSLDDFRRQQERDAVKIELAQRNGYTIFALAIQDLDQRRFEGWVRRIILHGKDYARRRQDHALLTRLTQLYAKIPYVQPPAGLFQQQASMARRGICGQIKQRPSWWRRLLGLTR